MKTKIIFAAVTLLMVFSCTKTDSDATPEPVNETASFIGTVIVEYKGEDVANEDILVDYLPSEDGSTAEITIHKIKFVPEMPVTIDVTIPSVTVSAGDNAINLSADDIVPLAMGGEYERYRVSNFTGSIIGDEFSFSLNFGSTPTRFTGVRQ